MNREVHVRFWESPEVKVLRATRQFETKNNVRDDSSFSQKRSLGARDGCAPDRHQPVVLPAGAASLSPHLLAQGIVTRMGRGKDSGAQPRARSAMRMRARCRSE
jgi:hypothetical protein